MPKVLNNPKLNPNQKVDTHKTEVIVAQRRFIRSTPDKLRKAAQMIKNTMAIQALAILEFSPMTASKSVELTLKQALAQAREKNIPEKNLHISVVKVNEGPKLKRRRIIHQGRATAILKRMSHLTIVLSNNENFKAQMTNDKQNDKNQKTEIRLENKVKNDK